ncbi:cytochrome P450 [Trametes coccinea BRFM310]|uniref:Cytochrome P450 n=1 Tax=Trametes coccinea (strain BRFM310) TaxID=1353009 RepID=A0A1Y2IL45_TRAC3|nr:cytochrome P450 [Trametes coccinea BRFM310]
MLPELTSAALSSGYYLLTLNGSVLAACVALICVYALTRRADTRRPPGPAPKALIGNLTDVPSGGNEWLGYAALARKYASDVVYFTVLGTHLLVINSFEAARDLLDKRGALYSDRPRLVMIKELMDWEWNLILMSYGKLFLAYRRTVQQEFQPTNVAELHHPVMTREVIAFLGRLLSTPDNLVEHLKHMAAAIIMMVTYGHQVESIHDTYVALAEAVREHAESRPGVEIVDMLPILKYLPAWFPGASFQREAAIARDLSFRMRTEPFKMVKERADAGRSVPCMATRLLSQDLQIPDGISQDDFVKNSCGVVYSAGADTTAAALRNFTLAMMVYPEVQKKAQAELDQVVGRDRLPTFEDRAQLPYVSKVVKESLRWKAVSPLGVPHATLDRDEYQGASIPKGTTVLANIYAILHDKSVYFSPDSFNPDRYSPSPGKPEGEPDPARAAFGFGRRICPGRFFAEDSLFLTIASMLHVFAISPPEGTTATKVYDSVKWSSGLVSHPTAFPFIITPRFDTAPSLVHAVQASC